MAAPVCNPSNNAWGFPFSRFSPTLVCWFMADSHSDKCEVLTHCGLICICQMISDVEHHFICPWPSMCLLFSASLSFFWLDFDFLMLSYMSSFTILDINSFGWINIFYLVSCHSLLLIVSFVAQKLLVWCSLICSYFRLFPLPKGMHPKIYILLRAMSKIFLPMFFSKSFMVSSHIFL